MLADFILYDTFLFWMVSAIFVGCFLFFGITEKGFHTTAIIVGAIVFFTLFSNINLINWVNSHSLLQIAEYIIAYFVIGTIWMFIKWIYFCFEKKQKYIHYRDKWISVNHSIPVDNQPQTKPNRYDYENYMSGNYINIQDLPPKIKKHKSDLAFWISYWHVSIIGTLLGNPLRYLINAIINLFSNKLNSIAKAMFSNFDELEK